MARKSPRSSNGSTPARRLAVMNLALRGIEADLGHGHADTFLRPAGFPRQRRTAIPAWGNAPGIEPKTP
jgi:hypothetical protein